MKTILLTLALIFSTATSFADQSSDESSEVGDLRKLEKGALAGRVRITGEVYVMDVTGKKLITQLPVDASWSPGASTKKIGGAWAIKASEIKQIVIDHQWEFHDDNSISGSIKLHEPKLGVNKAGQGDMRGKLIREEKFDLEYFGSKIFVVKSGDYQVVFRFTPLVDASRAAEQLDKLPIGGDTGTFQISDNQGNLWADNIRFGGVLAGLQTHRGSFVISLYPFKGAKELGFAKGRAIYLNISEKLRVKVLNDAEIVPDGTKAKVYGIYLPHLRSKSINSNWSFGQGSYEKIPEEFIKAIK